LERRTSLKNQLNDANTALKSLPSSALVDNIVSSSYYRAACEYYQVVGPAESYYKNALLYLAYTPMTEMSDSDQQTWAKSVSIAALVGEGVYNFGEVLSHDLLTALRGTSNEWMLEMLESFNRGDIAKFNTLLGSNKSAVAGEPAFASPASLEAIKKKITLLAVVELVFQRPSHQRTIPFVEIAKQINMNVDEVEWVLMRAMSVGLIKGVIDQVGQQLCATWVQPRVLDNSQMKSMATRLAEWGNNVNEVMDSVENGMKETIFGK
jgi:26S proteasome regulatory subunit N9